MYQFPDDQYNFEEEFDEFDDQNEFFNPNNDTNDFLEEATPSLRDINASSNSFSREAIDQALDEEEDQSLQDINSRFSSYAGHYLHSFCSQGTVPLPNHRSSSSHFDSLSITRWNQLLYAIAQLNSAVEKVSRKTKQIHSRLSSIEALLVQDRIDSSSSNLRNVGSVPVSMGVSAQITDCNSHDVDPESGRLLPINFFGSFGSHDELLSVPNTSLAHPSSINSNPQSNISHPGSRSRRRRRRRRISSLPTVEEVPAPEFSTAD